MLKFILLFFIILFTDCSILTKREDVTGTRSVQFRLCSYEKPVMDPFAYDAKLFRGQMIYIGHRVLYSGNDIHKMYFQHNQLIDRDEFIVEFKRKSIKKIYDIMYSNKNKSMAMIVSGQPVICAKIVEASMDGKYRISPASKEELNF